MRNYFIVFAFAVFNQFTVAEDTLHFKIPEVVVVSSRLALSQFDMNRSVTVIDSTLLRTASPLSVDEALRMFTTTELRRRGAMGIQTDIGIRGSAFSQQLVLFNGIRVNDPQTAHHNFDLPVSMNSIKHIEIVRGTNSAQYGPDALGGVINIVTNTNAPMLSAEVSGGQYGFFEGTTAYGTQTEKFQSLNSVNYKRSDGFHYDTEFETLSLSSQNGFDASWGKLHFFSGYTKKDFGAFDFYSPGLNIPSHEKTQTLFNSARTDFSLTSWDMSAQISHRNHFDDFIYDIRNPSLSHNRHNTNQYVAEFTGMRALNPEFTLSNSIELTHDNINSTKLGIHQREFAALSSVMRWTPEEQISIDGGLRVDAHSDYGINLHPILSIGYLISESSKIYGSAGTSFRAPSYTELYYSDPSTIGNSNLKPERGVSFEIGYHSQIQSSLSLQASDFYRQQNDLIDYVQYAGSTKYAAQNLSESTTQGMELQMFWRNDTHNLEDLKNVFFGYTYIDSKLDIKDALRTRYSFTHPKHQVNGSITAELPFEIMATFTGAYHYRINLPATSIFDLTILKTISSFDVILTATNIFNKTYEEIPGILLPGRWIIGKIRWNLL
ncbi:MAG: TonB-dependent receptor [Bacteroidota bacterium]|nr:TonB-dependent receptor [Bacteroidota bacterium]